MRILFNIHPRIWGGTETFTAGLVTHLDRRRFESHIYLPSKANTAAALRKASLPFTARPESAADELAFLRALLVRRRIDVVQAQHISSPVALAAKALGIPVVWRVAGHLDEIQKGKPAHVKRRSLALIGMVADRIVCPSDFLASQFDGLSVPSPVTTIHNGVDVRRLSNAARASSHPNAPFTVGLIGNLVSQKRHRDFIAAARIVRRRRPDARFRIYGADYPSDREAAYAGRLKALAAANGVTIETPARNRFGTYAALDVVVSPGINEGCSNAILEAMALGRPVVAARSGGNPELIDHGRSGWLVTPERPGELARAILALAEDPVLRRRMGAAAQARARRRFDMAVCAERYSRIYASLANARRTASTSNSGSVPRDAR